MTSTHDIDLLNHQYTSLAPLERLQQLFAEFDPNDILVTSSFGASSVYLLHLVNRIQPGHPIHFIDTQYHFPETLAYKQAIAEQLELNIVDLQPAAWEHEFTDEFATWKYDSDLCCEINKVNPLDRIKARHKVWISGLRRHQSAFRSAKPIFEWHDGILKVYPIIDVDHEEIKTWKMVHELPPHPLVAKGFDSIGCIHCTAKGDGREGRWNGQDKKECGLHQDRFKEQQLIA